MYRIPPAPLVQGVFASALLLTNTLVSALAAPSSVDAGGPLARLGTYAQSPKTLALIAAAIFVVAGIWLAIRRRKGLLLALVGVALLAATALGVREFRQRYPHQAVFNLERLGDSAAVLLGTDMRLSRYQPESLLVVEREKRERAAYPAIDVHFHLESLDSSIMPERLVQAMDAAGIAQVVNLGGTPGDFERFASTFTARYPDRFIMFVKPDFGAALKRRDGVAEQVKWVERAAAMGARGIKVSKSLGMGQRDSDGRIAPVDDPRLDPIWAKAGELGMPVLIHTSDTPAFFKAADGRNERYEEIISSPEWSRYGKPPSHEELLAQRDHVIARHPETIFIGAHMGMSEDNLAEVAARLDRYPNYYVDMAAVAHALGRQPVTARRFFIKYQDRILFSTDGGYGLVNQEPGWTPERLFRSYIEFLETANEYVEYPMWGAHSQGRWRIYGLSLPDEVLEKVYVRNAERIIPTAAAVAERLAGAAAEPAP